MSDNTFASQIYSRRKEMGLSLRDIARLSGIAASSISRIENGRLSPTLDNATKLAAVLNLDPPLGNMHVDLDRASALPRPEVQEGVQESSEEVVVYRKIGSTTLHGGIRRNLSRIAARNGYETAVLLRGALQLQTNNGFKKNLKPGATINCKIISKHTFFGIAAEEAELLWIG